MLHREQRARVRQALSQTSRTPWTPALSAFAVYVGAALVMFARPLLESHGEIAGFGADPQIFVWGLAWWPHALLHGINPFFTRDLYFPEGLDIAHGAMVPAAAILLAPVTALAGPLTAYNVGIVLSPALAAATAFLLCRRLSGSVWAALVGGWLFGFSPFVLGQMAGHLHLTLVFLVPVAVHLTLRAYAGELRPRIAATLLALTLVVQFAISAEVFSSLTLFGAVALLVAYGLGSAGERARLRTLFVTLGWAYLATLVVCAPYLYWAFQPGQVPASAARADTVAADALSYLVPSTFTLLGGATFHTLTARFHVGAVEAGAYLSLPLIAMAILGARAGRRTLGVRAALVAVAVAIVCSFGGHLHIAGHKTVPAPWALVNALPVLGQLLPARFVIYVFLAAAVLASIWIASTRHRTVAVALAAAAVGCAWPALAGGPWASAAGVPSLFASSSYRRVIGPRDVVLVLPIGPTGPSMLWQAEADFRFRLAGGYALPPEAPNPYKSNPLYPALNATPGAGAGPAMAGWLSVHRVTLIAMAPGAATTAPWEALLEGIGWHPTVRGGVLLMRRTRSGNRVNPNLGNALGVN